MFILSKLVEQVFFCKLRPIPLLCSEIFGNGESRHDRCMVDRVVFYLIKNLQCIAQCFGHVGKEFVHLFACLHPFLFGIKHTGRIIQILTGTQTDQTVVRFRILFVYKVNVIRTNQFDIEFLSILYQMFVHIHLQRVAFVIGTGNSRFMTLQLQIVFIAKQDLIPLYCFLRFGKLPGSNPLRHLTTETG